MADKLTDQYPDKAAELMAANSQRAPMSLRINTCVTSTQDYKNQLEAAAIGYTEGPWPEALILDHPQPASDLPGWSRGECAVQDLAAQSAGQIMMQLLSSNAVENGALQLLDACAAPGGKLFHIKEALTAAGLRHQLYALDNKAKRLDDIAHIGARLGHSTHLQKHTPISDDRQKIIAEDSIVLGCADAGESPLPLRGVRCNPNRRALHGQRHHSTQPRYSPAALARGVAATSATTAAIAAEFMATR